MDENTIDEIRKKIIEKSKEVKIEKDYSKVRLKFNPFPPAAIPRFLLPPIEEDIMEDIIKFIASTHASYGKEEYGEYAGLTIIGEYGMGKTHLMKFIKSLVDGLTKDEKGTFSAVTCYIDRPEDSPQRVIHRIIEQIGLDTIRKYIWTILIDEFQKDINSFTKKLKSRQTLYQSTDEEWKNLFNEPIKSNYLDFLNKFNKLGGNLKSLQEESRKIIKEKMIVSDDTLADRYLGLIFTEKKTDTSWDILAGYISSRDLQRKEVKFLNSIVEILRKNEFNLLYVLVDEFEDVSKLTGVKLTNYLLTMNTLINNEKRWAIIVSLTRDALNKIKEESVPLYDRLTSYKIELKPLDYPKAKKLVLNYLNIAREEKSDSLYPFSDELVKKMIGISKGNYRSLIRLAHKAIEHSLLQDVKLPLTENIMEVIAFPHY